MFAPLFLPLFAYLLYLWRGRKWTGNWRLSTVLVLGLVVLLWVLSWLIGLAALIKDPVFAQQFLASLGISDLSTFFAAAMSRRLQYIGGLLTLLALIIPALAFLLRQAHPASPSSDESEEERAGSGISGSWILSS